MGAEKPDSPIDDATYNVMMALASKLEAIDVYKKYSSDGSNQQIWTRLAEDDRRHADLLLEELQARLVVGGLLEVRDRVLQAA